MDLTKFEFLRGQKYMDPREKSKFPLFYHIMRGKSYIGHMTTQTVVFK